MYCSERCRKEAFDLYHRIECRILPWVRLMEDSGGELDNILLCLRMFLIGTKQGSLLTELMRNSNVYDCLEGKLNCVDVSYRDDYLSILNLPWRFDEVPPLSPKEKLNKLDIVSQLFRALRCVDFIEWEPWREEREVNLSSSSIKRIFGSLF